MSSNEDTRNPLDPRFSAPLLPPRPLAPGEDVRAPQPVFQPLPVPEIARQ
jgi:hypothetical protein